MLKSNCIKNWLRGLLFAALFALFGLFALPLAAQDAPAAPPGTPTTHPLKQILLADSPEKAQKLSFQPDGGFVVATGSLKHLESEEFTKRLIAAKDRNIDRPLVDIIAQVVSLYIKQRGYLIAEVFVPDQSVADGALRLAIVPAKFRQIKFVGNRWFSESQLRGDLQVNRGEILSIPDLDQAIAWTNDSNPFRRVQARVEQVPNTNEADLVVGVQEQLPLRLVAGMDDAGNSVLGNNHYTLAATYANLWNLDHQATYQYITTNRGQYFQGHVFNYRAPLPWRHYLQFTATYMRARPDLYGGYFNQDAKNLSGDLRYTVPLRRGDNPSELYADFSFKESNNNLEFGGTSVQNTLTDILELTLGASKVRRDKLGAWIIGVNATLSPGHLDSRNRDAPFGEARGDAKAGYVYGSFTFQRVLTLDRGWEFNSRGNVQVADGNLLASEQVTVGGAATVRGFNENVFAGDEGFVFDNDLLSPVWRHPVSVRGKHYVPLETRFLAFYDAAQVRNKHFYSLDPSFVPMASTGVGVRMSWASNFSVSADYGWQITHLPAAQNENQHGRGHLKVSLAY